MKEIWYNMVGYEGVYQYSNTLKFKSLPREILRSDGIKRRTRERELKIVLPKYGYAMIRLCLNKKGKTLKVHRFFAKAFIPNPENKKYVNHKNGNKHDYRLTNLEWATKSEDTLHAIKTGLKKILVGQQAPMYGRVGVKHPSYGRRGILNGMFGRKSGYHPTSKAVLNLGTGIFYETVKEAAMSINMRPNYLSEMLNNKIKNKTSFTLV